MLYFILIFSQKSCTNYCNNGENLLLTGGKRTICRDVHSPDPSGQRSQASTEASSSVPMYQGGPFSVAAADVEVICTS